MDIKQIFANRFSSLRIGTKMTQEQFAQAFSDYIDRDTNYSNLAISAWESGNKLPTLFVATNLSRYFGVSLDYLVGIGDDPVVLSEGALHNDDVVSASTLEANLIIKKEQIKGFDGQPVYVVFNNANILNRWGILDYSKGRVVFNDSIMKIKEDMDCTFYSNIPAAEQSPKYNIRKPLSMSQILKKTSSERIWVEMKSLNGTVKAKYNGWYKVNAVTECLENNNGIVLPLDGLSVGFDVYSSEG